MKITTWNAEWLDTSWGVVAGKYSPGQKIFPHTAPSAEVARNKINAVKDLFARLKADIVFICEGPKGEDLMQEFVDTELPEYDLIVRPPGQNYDVKGRQWLWYLVRKTAADQISPELLDNNIWKSFAATSSDSIEEDGKWMVSIPRLKTVGGIKDVPVSQRSSHQYHRHPQVLRFDSGGAQHEVIGAHLKSKFSGNSPRARKQGESFNAYSKLKSVSKYLATSHAARVKLSSEALNVRAYIDQRFNQEADPSIIIVGDLNDGPGKELMEREYLLHDLISNLQGEVFLARNFLNHALFDFPDSLRWTSKFKDMLDPNRNPSILLDHILFTQALTDNGTSPLHAKKGSGLVEHLAFEEVESSFGQNSLSDHRPVSVVLTER